MKILYANSYSSTENCTLIVFVEESFWEKEHHLADSGDVLKAVTKVFKSIGLPEIEESTVKLTIPEKDMVQKMKEYGYELEYSSALDNFIIRQNISFR